MDFKDYYRILGVAEQTSPDEIKKAYRKLARKYHPDVSKESDAEERFKELGEAYEVLKDPEKRAEYDQLKKLGSVDREGRFTPPPGWESASHFSAGGFTDADARQFSDFFESVFGRSGSAHRSYARDGHQRSFRMRGEDIHTRLALFLEEAFAGGERQITLRVPEVDEHGLVSHRDKTLNVKLPPGLGQGQHLRLRGQGAPGIGGGENGDLFIDIDIAPHPLFDIDGRNLLLTLPITPWEAALGAQVPVPTLGGKVNLRIPRGSVQGQRLRLKGKGMPGDPPGDQLIILQVVLPERHDPAAEALYKKLAELEGHFNPRAALGV